MFNNEDNNSHDPLLLTPLVMLWLGDPWAEINTMDLKCMLCVDMLGKIFLFSVSVKQKKQKKKLYLVKQCRCQGKQEHILHSSL